VDNDEVLTAAHCVADCNSDPIPLTGVQICLDAHPTNPNFCVGGAGTAVVAAINIPTSYSGGAGDCSGTDFGDDWAIINLNIDLAPDSYTAALSAANDVTLGSINQIKNYGTHGWTSGCTNNTTLAMLANNEQEPIAGILNQKLRFKIDNAAGSSGGPFYYCPAGSVDFCGFNDAPFVYGTMSGWNAVNNRAVGPKVPAKRSAMLAVFD
jgi:hypothetical protein